MDRCLAKELPDRMEAVRRKKMIPHIPWYYQIELPQAARNSGLTAKGAAAAGVAGNSAIKPGKSGGGLGFK